MKEQNGITLVALIITIIVMVILAGVIITAAVADGGIIDRAKISMIEKERAEIEEITKASYVIKKFASSTNSFSYLDLNQTADAIYENLTLNGFTVTNATEEGKIPVNTDPVTGEETGFDLNVKGDHGEYKGEVGISGIVGEIEVVTPETPEDSGEIENPEVPVVPSEPIIPLVTEVQDKVLSTEENIEVKDKYGNIIIVPAGFKITTDASDVTEGIVIEDVVAGNVKDEKTGKTTNPRLGSQFVWIPVGNIITSTGTKKIDLKRYVFKSDGSFDEGLSKSEEDGQLKLVKTASAYYTDVSAKEFKESAESLNGYYIRKI